MKQNDIAVPIQAVGVAGNPSPVGCARYQARKLYSLYLHISIYIKATGRRH